MRDFDYNLDGLAHYGMLPDMLQDLKNVGLPHDRDRRPVRVGRGVHLGLGAQRRDRRRDAAPAVMTGVDLMPSWYIHTQAAAETMEKLKAGVPAGRR